MTGRPDEGEDPRLADALRRALASSAAEVHPLGDGLTKIRARTADSRRQRWLVPVVAAGAAIVVGGGAVWAAGALGDDELPLATPPSQTMTNPTTSPSATGTTTVTETPVATEAPAPTATVPVYYLGAQQRESGLPMYKVFREYHRLPAEDAGDREERVRVALTEMLRNAPLDGDYFGRWPATAQVRDVTVDVDAALVTVDLSGLEFTDVRLPDPDGRLLPEVGEALVQQLVYTATGAASRITADDEFSALQVQLLVDGADVASVLGVDTSEPLRRDPEDYQAIVWITEPEWDESVRQPFTVHLVARFWEGGPGSWELRRDDAVVASGQTSSGPGDRWGDYEFVIEEELAPGTYELKVFDLGGSGDPAIAPYDTKTFTVQ